MDIGRDRMEEISEINTAGLKRFLKHLAFVSSKYKNREEAKEGLKKHMKKLKASSVGRKTKEEIMKEFNELEYRVGQVLERESEILRMTKGEEAAYKQLMKSVKENRMKMDQLNETLGVLRKKMEGISQTKLARETRIKRLEKKIKSSQRKKKSLPEITIKLKLLEQKYDKLKSNPKYSKNELDKIKFKIDSLKLKTAVSRF